MSRPSGGLVYWLGRIDAPHGGTLDPAADAGRPDATPLAGAGSDFAHDLGLALGRDLGRRRRRLVHGGGLCCDDEAALAGQQAMVNPAARPLPVTDFPPVLELGDDLDRHALALEDPVDRIACTGAATDVDLVGSERGKAGNWQARALPLLGGG